MKNIKSITMAFTIIMIVLACDQKGYFEGGLITPDNIIIFPQHPGLEPFSGSFTELDRVEIPIKVEGSASAVEVIDEDENGFGSVALTSGEGVFSETLVNLGLAVADDALQLKFSAPHGDGTTTRLFDVNVINPITLTPPDSLIDTSTEPVLFKYKIETVNATIDEVNVNLKVGESGTVSSLSGNWGESGEISLLGTDYAIDDTVFVQIQANSGSLSSDNWKFIVVTESEED